MTDASLAIQEYILSRLKAEPRLASLSAADQIRTVSDQSDPAVGDAAIVVACSDLGNRLGIPGRILVDVRASVEVRSSLSADQDLSRFSSLASAAFSSLASIPNDTPVDGWHIRHGSAWSEGEIAQDAMFRYQEFSATILLQSAPSTHQENQPQP